MKKVGILTLFYKTWNFGAQLQACALQRVIQRLGYECELIRFAWSHEQTRLNYETASVNQAAFEEFARQIPHSRRIYTSEDLNEANEEYDIFVCGSDQIWGVKDSMPMHVLPQMALSFVRDGKGKLAYGASMGAVDITEERKEVLRCFLNRLDFISVREPSAIPTIRKMTERKVTAVLDPTMLLSAGEWMKVAAEGGGICPKEPYVLLYNLSGREELTDRAAEFAQGRGLRLFNLAYLAGMPVGPCDFINLIAHAEYVLTNSFHGSIFSVLFHKRFLSFGVDSISTAFSKNARVKDMLEVCGLGKRFLPETEDRWLSILEEEIEYDSVDRRIQEAAKASVDFLRKGLGKGKIERNKNGEKASELLGNTVVKAGECTGCSACTKCEFSCIKMTQDKLGFYRPEIHAEACTDCGQCLRRCPVYAAGEPDRAEHPPLSVIAVRAKEEDVLSKSSSGGVFSVLAERFIRDGGIVCGAVYDKRDNFTVRHICVHTEEELNALRKSKYVQSDMNCCYAELEGYLKQGKKVLYTGTPCQAAGLRAFLQKDYEELYIMDLICGGVTAPLLWEKYSTFYRENYGTEAFDMRAKQQGFFRENGGLAFSISHLRRGEEYCYEKEKDLFLGARFSFYNESCYHCRFKNDYHAADLTVGDCIGFHLMAPDNQDKGISLVLTRSRKGRELLEGERENFIVYDMPYEDAVSRNEMIACSMRKPLGTDYLRGIAEEASIEKIYYESQMIKMYQEKEMLHKSFILELKRNELLSKVKKYAMLQCRLEKDPLIKGDIVIYGAGKIGRALLDCFDGEPLCFLDRSDKLNNVCGYAVYQLECIEFKKLYREKRITVLITPVWDYWEIREQLEGRYPELNIVSLDKVVEKIWI